MADITISDLELAPALADDMVFPVENTTDTYAATLAMLRRLINKTFVEVENADFNALTDDGFYQCTGTPTNSPVAGAINWTLQVSAENGVVVQRAFSLDDNFANLYIRRWNGVTWTGWLEVGAGALANKANVSNTVTTDTVQTITGLKTFNNGSGNNRTNIMVVTDDGVGEDVNNKWAGSIQFKKGNMDVAFCEALKTSSNQALVQLVSYNSVNGQNIFAGLRVVIESNGYAFASAPTPSAGATREEIVTAGWFRQAGCTARTVIEAYRNGSNWYRVWSDGWCEQGGVITAEQNGTTINFLKPFIDANYVVVSSQMYRGFTNDPYNGNNEIGGIEPSRCVFYSGVAGNNTQRWIAQGYIA